MYVCMYVYACVCMGVNVTALLVRMYACMNVCMHVCVCMNDNVTARICIQA